MLHLSTFSNHKHHMIPSKRALAKDDDGNTAHKQKQNADHREKRAGTQVTVMRVPTCRDKFITETFTKVNNKMCMEMETVRLGYGRSVNTDEAGRHVSMVRICI